MWTYSGYDQSNKYFNISVRFSVFVKSGGESFLLGATTADNKPIMANDVALIVVSYYVAF